MMKEILCFIQRSQTLNLRLDMMGYLDCLLGEGMSMFCVYSEDNTKYIETEGRLSDISTVGQYSVLLSLGEHEDCSSLHT